MAWIEILDHLTVDTKNFATMNGKREDWIQSMQSHVVSDIYL